MDKDRGLDIMGFVPLSQVIVEDRANSQSPVILNESTREPSAPLGQVPDLLEIKVSETASIQVESMHSHNSGETQRTEMELFAPELGVEGWASMEAIGISEILLYIHGYNNNREESIMTVGQMAAFGNFPPHLKIITFHWPAGSGLASFWTAKRGAESDKCHRRLRDLLVTFIASGIRECHVLCHSMGSRLFLKSFRKIAAEGNIISRVHSETRTREVGMLQLLTCTFLNPEY